MLHIVTLTSHTLTPTVTHLQSHMSNIPLVEFVETFEDDIVPVQIDFEMRGDKLVANQNENCFVGFDVEFIEQDLALSFGGCVGILKYSGIIHALDCIAHMIRRGCTVSIECVDVRDAQDDFVIGLDTKIVGDVQIVSKTVSRLGAFDVHRILHFFNEETVVRGMGLCDSDLYSLPSFESFNMPDAEYQYVVRLKVSSKVVLNHWTFDTFMASYDQSQFTIEQGMFDSEQVFSFALPQDSTSNTVTFITFTDGFCSSYEFVDCESSLDTLVVCKSSAAGAHSESGKIKSLIENHLLNMDMLYAASFLNASSTFYWWLRHTYLGCLPTIEAFVSGGLDVGGFCEYAILRSKCESLEEAESLSAKCNIDDSLIPIMVCKVPDFVEEFIGHFTNLAAVDVDWPIHKMPFACSATVCSSSSVDAGAWISRCRIISETSADINEVFIGDQHASFRSSKTGVCYINNIRSMSNEKLIRELVKWNVIHIDEVLKHFVSTIDVCGMSRSISTCSVDTCESLVEGGFVGEKRRMSRGDIVQVKRQCGDVMMWRTARVNHIFQATNAMKVQFLSDYSEATVPSIGVDMCGQQDSDIRDIAAMLLGKMDGGNV